MASKSFPVGRIVVLGLELFALILINVAGYYVLRNAERTNTSGPFAATERALDAYPVFTGTVVEIEARNAIDQIVAAQDGDWQAPDTKYKRTDSVTVGIESAATELSGLNPAFDGRHGLVVSEWGGEVIPKP